MASNAEPVKETPGVAAEGKGLKDYELVVIVSPETSDEKLEARVQGISQFVLSRGGAVDSADRWGKKRMAYPIKHFTEGNYIFYRMKLPATASRELEQNLRISEDVIRHLLVKTHE